MNSATSGAFPRSPLTFFQAFLLLLFPLISGILPAQSQNLNGIRIDDIVVEGAVSTDPQNIVNAMSLKVGDRYSDDLQRQDIQSIADLGFYNPLQLNMLAERVEGGGLRLIVSVQENPLIESITFIGNMAFESERLLRELDYEVGDILPIAAKSRTRRNVESFYGKGGYSSTRVRVSVEAADESETSVHVTIAINEGERIKISDLRIEGNDHFSKWHLRTMVSNSGSWLIFNNYYDDKAFDDDLLVITNRYRGNGFLDVTVRRGEFEYDEEKGRVSPEIIINEGPRYSVQDVVVTGRTLFTEDEVQSIFVPLQGKTYDGFRFREAISKLRQLYGNQGYANASIDGTFERDPASGTVNLILDITENEIVTIGDVIIRTQNYDYQYDLNALEQFIDYTSPGVTQEAVEREVKLVPGEKFRTANEIRTRDRLQRLGFFKDVRVVRKPTEDPNVDDVVVEVEEDPSASFILLSGGVGELSGPSVRIQYINPNLFGDARQFSATANLGSRVRSFNLRYLDRYLGETDTSMDLNAYRRYIEFDGITERAYGGSAEFGKPLSDFNKGFVGARTEWVDLKSQDSDLREDTDPYLVATANARFQRDTTNPERWTYEGYQVGAGVESGWADYFLFKMTHDYRSYHALSRDNDWVYHYGHNVGLIPYDAERIGYSERFFMGGTSSLRGFRPRGAGPKDEGDRDVNVGGSVLLTQRHELRKRFSRQISGRIFVDAGYLQEDPWDHGDRVRVGAGGGFSVDVGPFIIDLDVAAPVVQSGRDQTRVLHFRIRSNF